MEEGSMEYLEIKTSFSGMERKILLIDFLQKIEVILK